MKKIILIVLIFWSTYCFANTEISTPGTNIGIGTISQSNALSINNTLAIGDGSFTSVTAPTNGLIIEGNVGIGQLIPATKLDVNGTLRTTQLTITGIAGTQCLQSIGGVVAGTGGACGSGGGGGGSGVTFTDGVNTVSGTTQLTISGGTVGGTTPNGTLLINASPGLWQFAPGNVGIDTFNNVGIGTISPQFALQVAGTGQFSSSVIVGSGAATVTGDNNGNVGIGSSTPSQKLDVAGTVRMVGFKLPTGATNTYVLTSDASGNGTWALPGGGSGNVGVGTVNYIPEFISVGTLGPSNIVDVAGNVGIGSSTPEYGFVVGAGGAKFVSLSPPSPDSNFVSNVGIGSSVPGGKLDVEGTISPIVFDAISGAKNVGIGSFNPGAKLDVQGSLRINGVGHGIVFQDGTSMLTAASGSGGSGTVTSIIAGTGLTGGTITTTGTVALDLTHANTWTGQQIFNTANVGIGSLTPGTSLDVNGTVRSVQFIANGTGNSTFTNNIGIGTLSPGESLDINNSGSVGNARINGTGALYMGSDNLNFMVGTSSTVGGMAFWANGANRFSTLTGSGLAGEFFGNVGIGSATPGGSLDVGSGKICLGHVCDSAWPSGGSATSGSNMLFGNGSGAFTNVANTATDGTNVGIGSATPGQLLDVKGTVRAINFVGSSSGLTGLPTGSQFATQNTTDVSLAGGNVGIGTTKTTTAALTVMNGNVGIGTWVPAFLVDLANNSANNVNTINVNTGNTGEARFRVNAGSTATIEYAINLTGSTDGNGLPTAAFGLATASGEPFVLANNNAEHMRIDTAGNVSIGTTATPFTLTAYGATTNVIEAIDTATPSSSAGAGISGYTSGLPSASGQRLGFYLLGGNDAGTYRNVTGIQGFSDQAWTTGSAAGSYLTLETTPNGSVTRTERMRINNAGNIGIGSTNPGQALDVVGTVRFSSSLINTKSSTGIGWSEHNATNQACNTTCGTSACVIGLDIGTVGVVNSGFVACSDATADDCICAGP